MIKEMLDRITNAEKFHIAPDIEVSCLENVLEDELAPKVYALRFVRIAIIRAILRGARTTEGIASFVMLSCAVAPNFYLNPRISSILDSSLEEEEKFDLIMELSEDFLQEIGEARDMDMFIGDDITDEMIEKARHLYLTEVDQDEDPA